jgi:hypothetical protein
MQLVTRIYTPARKLPTTKQMARSLGGRIDPPFRPDCSAKASPAPDPRRHPLAMAAEFLGRFSLGIFMRLDFCVACGDLIGSAIFNLDDVIVPHVRRRTRPQTLRSSLKLRRPRR